MKKLISFLISAAVAVCMTAFTAAAQEESKGVAILYTNDVHCGFSADDSTLGIAQLVAYKARLESENYQVILVDAGDFIQGETIGTLSEGGYPLDVMNKLGYDIAVPGNHEFDYGTDIFFKLAGKAEFPYISCNFTDLESGEKPFAGYKIVETDKYKIGFVGITTPATLTTSNPDHFFDEKGGQLYGFCGGDEGESLYNAVQEAVDGAVDDGADLIVAVGHLGEYDYDYKWSSESVINNVSGINLFIDGHAHKVTPKKLLTNEKGEETILTSTGSKLANFGTILIEEDNLSVNLISKEDFVLTTDETSSEYKAYTETAEFLGSIEEQYDKLAGTVVASTQEELTINNPETGERAVRNSETNMADLCTDAYRIRAGADIGLINGGGVRSSIPAGDITYGSIINVQPFGNSICVAEISGQQLLDALEMGACFYPKENGSFMQVSGLTYEIHSYIPSSVTLDENGNFTGVSGEYRVKNVLVGGEPLELSKTYTVASIDFLLISCGGGMTMFEECNVTEKEIMLDYQAVIDYIKEDLGGTVGEKYSAPSGCGRIKVVSQAVLDEEKPDSTDTENPSTGAAISLIPLIAAAVMLVACRKRNCSR